MKPNPLSALYHLTEPKHSSVGPTPGCRCEDGRGWMRRSVVLAAGAELVSTSGIGEGGACYCRLIEKRINFEFIRERLCGILALLRWCCPEGLPRPFPTISSDLHARLVDLGAEPISMGPAEFDALLRDESASAAEIFHASETKQ